MKSEIYKCHYLSYDARLRRTNLWFSNAELMAVATNKQQAHSSGI